MKLTSVLLLALFGCLNVFSQSLKLKTGFGVNGRSTTNLAYDANTTNEACALQPDGKILLGGTGLTRILPGGGLDSSFGIDGSAFLEIYPTVNAIAIQPDGKILCLLNNNDFIECRRININGSIDSSFNLTGKALIKIENIQLYSRFIALQPDGRILVSGVLDSAGRTSFFAARLLANGLPDSSFNSTGTVRVQIAAAANSASGIGLQADGKIIITGSVKEYDSLRSTLAVIRLHPNGIRDMSFNGTGVFKYESATISGGEYGQLVNVFANNKILVTGGTNAKLLLIKLSAAGTADSSFNGTGIAITEIGEFNSPAAVHIRPDGRILVTGITAFYQTENTWDYAAYQFTATGQPDLSFSGDGKMNLPLPGIDRCGGSVLQDDGKFVLTGYRDNKALMNAIRFNSNGSIDNTYAVNGINYLQVRGTDERIKKLLIQPDGKIIAAGIKSEGVNNKSSIGFARYSSNGVIDSSFGTNGIALIEEPGFWMNAALLQTDGKIIVSGWQYNGYPDYTSFLAIMRLHSNGTRDNSFAASGGGLFLIDSAFTDVEGNNMVLLPGGKILVACNYADDDESIMLVRLNTDGTADNTFGIGGRKVLPADTSVNYPAALVLLSDGKFLLGGNKALQDSLSQGFVMRLMQDGNIDPSFGNSGFTTAIPSLTAFTEMNSLSVGPGGKIYLAGSVYEDYFSENMYPYITRFNANGSVDSSFNQTGHLICYRDINNLTWIQCNAIALHPDSSLYITGIISDTTFNEKRFVIRIKNNGTMDSTLAIDGSGWRLSEFKSRYSYSEDIKITTDSTILVAEGVLNSKDDLDFSITAYKRLPTNEGRLYTFNGNGNWNNPSNWSYGTIPPATLPNGSIITIAPANGDSCILNTVQNLSIGSCINIVTGANLIIQSNLVIKN